MKAGAVIKKHGLSYHPTYRVWVGIRGRCMDENHPAFPDYGGRGITICKRWADDVAAFIADVGERPSPKHEIDRIDNERGYEPGNVRWATRSENDRNRRNNVWVTYNGESRLLIELCEARGIRTDTVQWRIDKGWPVESAVDTPARPKAPNGSRPVRPPSKSVRLPPEQKRALAARYAAGGISHAKLAVEFGIKPSTVGVILKDPRWTNGGGE